MSGPTFQAGTYALSESGGPAGYTASAWSCVKNNAAPVIGSNITLGLGDSAVCTITNNDIAPTLKLVKVVFGGSAQPNEWDLTADRHRAWLHRGEPIGRDCHRTDGQGQRPVCALRVVGPGGYLPGNWSCVSGGNQVGSKSRWAR